MNSKLAIVFPGQGSQSIGMLSALAERFPLIEQTFAQASQTLGYDLWNLAQNGPETELNLTWHTQPVLLTASVALWRVWQSVDGLQPQIMAGHSLGEYSALVCAGVIEFGTALRLVELRGKLMQEAVPQGNGAMYAIIGLDDQTIVQICATSAQGEIVSPVNYNSPAQVVIAGHRAAVERAATACKAAGAKRVLPLTVSAPSHCALMRPAADKLAVALAEISLHTPQFPVINNVDVRIESSPQAIRDALIRQLYHPVRWTETVEKMAAQGIECLIEMGPGKVLTGLTKRIVGTLTGLSVSEPQTFFTALEWK